jgi:hypothetical protein
MGQRRLETAWAFRLAAVLVLAVSACDDGGGGPSCGDDTCSGHGTCAVVDGATACTCNAGYTGEACDACATGYQDGDGDGTCEEDCGTAGLACGDNAHCDDAGGTAACTCDDGTQDNDGNGDCEPDCATAALDCSGHGTCDDADGTARCLCDEGYDRSDCSVCESAYYQDFDGDGTCTPTCYFSASTFTCGEHQVCSHASGSLECVCDEGFQDNDDNGSCLPNCRTAQDDATAPLVCPDPNGVCDDTSGTAACRCRLGFADDPAATGEDCLACAAGYQDNDADGTCTPDCATAAADGLACVLGCDDASGTARCTCAAGEQDNDGDGTCTADCTTAALACDAAAHRVCDDASGTARCACETGTYDDGMGTCRTAGTGDGDGCAFAMDLDLAAEVVYVETTGASPTHSFSCNSMGFSLRDVFYRVHLGAGETRRVRFTLERVDVAGVSFTPALAVLSGATCDTGTEIACGFGFDPETYTRSSAAIDVTLDGGTAGTDYYLVVGTYDRRGRAIRGILRIEQLCDGGGVYSALLDACVDDPCNPTNPCTAPHRTRCAADVSTATPTYECLCDVGYFDDAGACTANASAAGDGCADVAPIEVLEGEGWVDGSTADAVDDAEGTCRGDRPARDRVYGFALNRETRVGLTLSCDAGYDCLIHMRSACDDPDTELFCSDTGAEGGQESATVTLDPGVYYLFIDGWNSRDDESLSDGDYTLEYSFHTNPCADESAACPGEPLCVAAADWSAYECTCPTAGEVLFEGSCVADPCNPNPCGDLEHGVCSPDLAAGSYECVCGGIYVDDGASGCVLATDAEWTIFWYLAMDNNLYYQTAHELDDVMAAGFSPDVRVVALVDRLDEPRGYYGEFGPASVDRVVELGEPDTGNWETLRDFGLWAVENYPAQHYALVVSDHGGAWRSDGTGAFGTPPATRGICWDDHSDTPDDGIGVATGELAMALDAITVAAGRKLDLVVYDACLMSEWEVANVTEPYADYMIASPDSNYGFMVRTGAWTDWLDTLVAGAETMTPLDVGEAYVDNYRATMETDPQYVTTIAMTELDTVPALDDAVSGFADALLAANTGTFFDDVDAVRRGAQQTAYNELVDLEDFARLVGEMDGAPADVATAAGTLRSQLDRSILYSYANIDLDGWSPYYGSVGLAGQNGLTVYLPGRFYQFDTAYTGTGATWSARATWDEFLAAFANGSYSACAGADPVLDHLGDTVSTTVGITNCCGARYLVQTFRAPGTELHGVRIAIRKVSGDGATHQGFYFALSRPGEGFIWGPAHWGISPNGGEPQGFCLARMGVPTEPGETLELVLGGGDPYPGGDGGFTTPIQWPIQFASAAGAAPPYAEGEARVIEGDAAAVSIGTFNGDGIEGTFWFEVY